MPRRHSQKKIVNPSPENKYKQIDRILKIQEKNNKNAQQSRSGRKHSSDKMVKKFPSLGDYWVAKLTKLIDSQNTQQQQLLEEFKKIQDQLSRVELKGLSERESSMSGPVLKNLNLIQNNLFSALSQNAPLDNQLKSVKQFIAQFNSIVGAYMTHQRISEVNKERKAAQEEMLEELNRIQSKFKDGKLKELSEKINSMPENSSMRKKAEPALEALNLAQEQLFNLLREESRPLHEKLNAMNQFKDTVKNQSAVVDKIMGHGWLYRTVEFILKLIVGLFAGVGMLLGSVAKQGLASEKHRERYRNTFFSKNQTAVSKTLQEVEEEVESVSDEIQKNFNSLTPHFTLDTKEYQEGPISSITVRHTHEGDVDHPEVAVVYRN